jgi:hypothetical protein
VAIPLLVQFPSFRYRVVAVEAIRTPLQPNQPVEHDLAKWDIKVV